eukprot:11375622-Alexandrium_andersonii.AAC.1
MAKRRLDAADRHHARAVKAHEARQAQVQATRAALAEQERELGLAEQEVAKAKELLKAAEHDYRDLAGVDEEKGLDPKKLVQQIQTKLLERPIEPAAVGASYQASVAQAESEGKQPPDQWTFACSYLSNHIVAAITEALPIVVRQPGIPAQPAQAAEVPVVVPGLQEGPQAQQPRTPVGAEPA